MKSLNGYSPDYIKEFISERLNVPIKNIRLFGSRINRDYYEESDLDIAIIGEYTKEREGVGFRFGNLEIELHWTDSFEYSWLRNSI
jgi:predicted nucleotidyltransferase